MFDVMMADPVMVAINKRIYNYHINPGSISTNRNISNSRQWVKDMMQELGRISREVDGFKDEDPALCSSCRKSLDLKMYYLCSRMLSAAYSVKEFKALLNECKESGMLPPRSVPDCSKERRQISRCKVITSCPNLYPVNSFLYRKVFLPFLYPFFKRLS